MGAALPCPVACLPAHARMVSLAGCLVVGQLPVCRRLPAPSCPPSPRPLRSLQLTMDGWLAHMPGKPGCYALGVRACSCSAAVHAVPFLTKAYYCVHAGGEWCCPLQHATSAPACCALQAKCRLTRRRAGTNLDHPRPCSALPVLSPAASHTPALASIPTTLPLSLPAAPLVPGAGPLHTGTGPTRGHSGCAAGLGGVVAAAEQQRNAPAG